MSALRIIATGAAAAAILAALLLVEAPSPPYVEGYYIIDVDGSYTTTVVPDGVEGDCRVSHPEGLPAVFIAPWGGFAGALRLGDPHYCVLRLFVNNTLYVRYPPRLAYGFNVTTYTWYVVVMPVYANKYEKVVVGRVVGYDYYQCNLYIEGRVSYVYIVNPDAGVGEPIKFTGRCRLYYASWKAPFLQRKIDIYR